MSAVMSKRKHPEAVCEECPLAGAACAPSIIPRTPQVKAAVVARSPGYHEAKSGKPFSGPSGKVLDFLLRSNGVSRDEVLLTNVVLCAPPAGTIPPEAIKACAPRVRKELAGIPLVVACGSEAVNLLLGRGTIDSYRGFRHEKPGRTVVATNNPALVLRDDSTFPNLRSDFRRAFNPPDPPVLPRTEVIENVNDAKQLLSDLLGSPGLVAGDIESRGGLSPRQARLVSIQFATNRDVAYVIGERKSAEGTLWEDASLINDYLRPFLESREHQFLWFNGKFDCKVLRQGYGIQARIDHDAMLMSHALDERSGGDEHVGVHSLGYLLSEHLYWPNYEPDYVTKWKKSGGTLELTDEQWDGLFEYAGLDTTGTLQLYEFFYPQMVEQNLLKPYTELVIEGAETTMRMELHGMVYNTKAAADIYEFEVGPEMDSLTTRMQTMLDNPMFNPRSPLQVARYFYDEWGIQHDMQKRPDKKRSVDDSARKEILANRFSFKGERVPQRKGNIVELVEAEDAKDRRQFYIAFTTEYARYQEIQKQASTYLLKMIERAEADPESRIYTELLLHGTNSYRLASRGPNLQNITRTKEGLPNIRSLFGVPEGSLLVQADYSQAELRCIAQLSGDSTLRQVYLDGLDLHSMVAERFYGPNFTKEQRSNAKNMDFGVFYQQSAATFQEKHGISEREGQKFIDWTKTQFKTVWEWEAEVAKQVHKPGYVVSPWLQRRRFYLITEENKNAAYREAVNFLPQNTASNLTLAAANKMRDEIDPKRGSLVLSVHDSILAEADEDYATEVQEIMVQVMESRAKECLGWDLPFTADASIGPTWG